MSAFSGQDFWNMELVYTQTRLYELYRGSSWHAAAVLMRRRFASIRLGHHEEV